MSQFANGVRQAKDSFLRLLIRTDDDFMNPKYGHNNWKAQTTAQTFPDFVS